MCLNKIQADRKQFLRLKWMTFLAVAVSKCLADSPLTTIFHFHVPLYFPVPARSRSRSNKIPQEKLFLWYFRSYWMQHQQEISWERLFLRSFQAPVGNPSGLVEENSKKKLRWVEVLLLASSDTILPASKARKPRDKCWSQGWQLSALCSN